MGFIAKSTVRMLHVTEETADVFAEVKTALTLKGIPIPLNDVWISAHYPEAGSVLVTYDGHFAAVGSRRPADMAMRQLRLARLQEAPGQRV